MKEVSEQWEQPLEGTLQIYIQVMQREIFVLILFQYIWELKSWDLGSVYVLFKRCWPSQHGSVLES